MGGFSLPKTAQVNRLAAAWSAWRMRPGVFVCRYKQTTQTTQLRQLVHQVATWSIDYHLAAGIWPPGRGYTAEYVGRYSWSM